MFRCVLGSGDFVSKWSSMSYPVAVNFLSFRIIIIIIIIIIIVIIIVVWTPLICLIKHKAFLLQMSHI